MGQNTRESRSKRTFGIGLASLALALGLSLTPVPGAAEEGTLVLFRDSSGLRMSQRGTIQADPNGNIQVRTADGRVFRVAHADLISIVEGELDGHVAKTAQSQLAEISRTRTTSQASSAGSTPTTPAATNTSSIPAAATETSSAEVNRSAAESESTPASAGSGATEQQPVASESTTDATGRSVARDLPGSDVLPEAWREGTIRTPESIRAEEDARRKAEAEQAGSRTVVENDATKGVKIDPHAMSTDDPSGGSAAEREGELVRRGAGTDPEAAASEASADSVDLSTESVDLVAGIGSGLSGVLLPSVGDISTYKRGGRVMRIEVLSVSESGNQKIFKLQETPQNDPFGRASSSKLVVNKEGEYTYFYTMGSSGRLSLIGVEPFKVGMEWNHRGLRRRVTRIDAVRNDDGGKAWSNCVEVQAVDQDGNAIGAPYYLAQGPGRLSGLTSFSPAKK